MGAALGTSALYQGDVQRFLDKEVLPVAQRHLVVRQFAQKIRVPEGMGLTFTATRYNRFVLPFGPIAEGIAPPGQAPSISQVTGILMQWGDRANITDIAEITPMHDVLVQAGRMLELQLPETLERNSLVQLMGAVQVNFVNQRGSRAAIVAGDLLDPITVNRTVANLKTLGAYMMNGPTGEQVRKDIEEGPRKAKANPATHEHYVAVAHPIPLNDFANNSTVQLAWSYSDINMLYINEVGQWRGIHFCESNMVPFWVGLANNDSGAAYAAVATGGTFAGGAYTVQITGSDPQNQYEQRIYQPSAPVTVVANGSISVTLPSSPANYTYSVYVGLNPVPANLGTSNTPNVGVPSTGPYAGQAVQLLAGSTVTITGLGVPQVPPAPPATGVTVFPTYVFGEHYFAALELSNVTWHRLTNADKSDPLNQLRIIGWKMFDGFVILNQLFGARIESAASGTGQFG
jgi:N4-gp56 family major capsid protein